MSSFWSRAVLLALATGLTTIAPAAPGDTELVSVRLPGQSTGDDPSDSARISGNGQFVVFVSRAADLVPGDTAGQPDVFVRNLATGTTERVSVSSSGVQANGDSRSPSVSADGRYVAFLSYATELVPGDTDATADLFVRDRQAHTTQRLAGEVNIPSISGDGRYVAFISGSSVVVPNDTNNAGDAFVVDRQTGLIERVSVSSAEQEGDRSTSRVAISFDGRYVAFQSAASNLVPGDTNRADDIFVRDRQTGTTSRISVGAGGVQAIAGSANPSISSDGRFVAFTSFASNLVPGDTNGQHDVFVRDRQSQVTERVNLSSGGAQAKGWSSTPDISGDGRFVTFASYAANLVPGDTGGKLDVFVRDRQQGTIQRVSITSSGVQGNDKSEAPSISSDGRRVAFASFAANLVTADRNASEDIFVYDRQTLAPTLVSRSAGLTNAAGGGLGGNPTDVSSDGRYVTFVSGSANVAAADTNSGFDVFLRDRQLDTVERVSVGSGGVQANGDSFDHAMSADARYVVFSSYATNLDSVGVRGVFLRDRQANTTTRVCAECDDVAISRDGNFIAFVLDGVVYVQNRATGVRQQISGTANVPNDIFSMGPSLNATGRYVAFISNVPNMVPGSGGNFDVFVRDRQTGVTERLSVTPTGDPGNDQSAPPMISASGRYVVFYSYASNLVPGDRNLEPDVFIRDRQSDTTDRIDIVSTSVVFGGSFNLAGVSISADGRYVAFASGAALVPEDVNETYDVYVRDRTLGVTELVAVSSSGEPANFYSESPVMTGDGRFVVFGSQATNLVPTDLSPSLDTYVRERALSPP
jgi:Tol biopolymer transport system component